MAVATKRNGGSARPFSLPVQARRALAVPRVEFLLRVAFPLALLWISPDLSVLVDPGTLAGQCLIVFLPLILAGTLGVILARRALSVSLAGAIGVLAVLPLATALVQHGMGRPGVAWQTHPVVWFVLLSCLATLLAIPSRRMPNSPFSTGAAVIIPSLLAVAACLGAAETVPEIAVAIPFSGEGVALTLGVWAVLIALALGFHAGMGEPVEERVHPHIADTDQIWGSLVIVALAIAAAAYAWVVPGKSLALVSSSPAVVLPTAILYALPVLGLYWVVFGRLASTKAFWAIALAMTGAAYHSWYSARSSTADGVARHYAAVSANPRRDASPEIASIVFAMGRPVVASEASTGLGGLRLFEVVEGQAYEILPPGGKARVAALPDRHFRVSAIPFPDGVAGSRAMVVEQVDYGRAVPVAVDVEGRVREPLLPPMLSRDGWLSVERTIHPVDTASPRMGTPDVKAAGFVAAVLRGKTFVRNPAD